MTLFCFIFSLPLPCCRKTLCIALGLCDKFAPHYTVSRQGKKNIYYVYFYILLNIQLHLLKVRICRKSESTFGKGYTVQYVVNTISRLPSSCRVTCPPPHAHIWRYCNFCYNPRTPQSVPQCFYALQADKFSEQVNKYEQYVVLLCPRQTVGGDGSKNTIINVVLLCPRQTYGAGTGQ